MKASGFAGPIMPSSQRKRTKTNGGIRSSERNVIKITIKGMFKNFKLGANYTNINIIYHNSAGIPHTVQVDEWLISGGLGISSPKISSGFLFDAPPYRQGGSLNELRRTAL